LAPGGGKFWNALVNYFSMSAKIVTYILGILCQNSYLRLQKFEKFNSFLVKIVTKVCKNFKKINRFLPKWAFFHWTSK